MDMSGGVPASQGSFSGGGNQLSQLVPSYNPASDDLLIFSQKVELLAQAWPEERRSELVARLMLNCTGSAFHKLQLHRDELMKGDKDSVQKLITLLGGYWGRIPLEKRYEITERALFRCHQKGDESHDSYLARADIAWSEMLSRKTTLAELQAYIILRGSQLSSDDKKRVILESDASGDGALAMERVSKAVRMLGAGFFQELVTGKKQVRNKTYDYSTAFTAEEIEEDEPDTLVTWTEDQEEEAFEVMLADGDEDAVLVADYEAAVSDLVQSDPELAATYNSYAEARRRLNDKFKHRGFWPVRAGSKGKGGKSKGKGKGPRRSLQSRILSSNCRICGQRGHWKAECPLRGQGSQPAGAPPPSSFTGLAEAFSSEIMETLPPEFLEIPEVPLPTEDAPCPEPNEHFALISWGFSGRPLGKVDPKLGVSPTQRGAEWASHRQFTPGDRSVLRMVLRHELHHRSVHAEQSSEIKRERVETHPVDAQISADALSVEAGTGAHGIVDSGATKTVIGSMLLKPFIEALLPTYQAQLGRCPCKVTFRFGNQGTLESTQALVVALGKLRLKIAVVPGRTPLLLSNTLLRTLHASIDAHQKQLTSPFMCEAVNLSLTPRGLFVLDMNELIARMSQAELGNMPSSTFHAETRLGRSKDSSEDCPVGALSRVRETASLSEPHVRCPAAPRDHPEQLLGGASPEALAEGLGESQGVLRQGSPWQDLSAGVERGAEVAHVILSDIRRVTQGLPSESGPLCPSEDLRAGGGPGFRSQVDLPSPSGDMCPEPSDPEAQEFHGQGTQFVGDQGRELGDGREPSRDSRRTGHGDADALQSHGSDGDGNSADPGVCSSHGSGTLGPSSSAGDVDGDDVPSACFFSPSWPSHEKSELERLVHRYDAELRKCLREVARIGRSAQVFEVFCGVNSTLSHQCMRQGTPSERFGFPNVDLTTREGRWTLFQRLSRGISGWRLNVSTGVRGQSSIRGDHLRPGIACRASGTTPSSKWPSA